MTMISNDYLFTESGARLHQFSHDKTDSSSNCLLVPPPGLSSDSLTELAKVLKNKINCCIWMLDHPNDGDNTNENYSFANWQPALIEALTLLNRPIVIGHSTGGMFLQSIAELEELASGLILIASAPDMEWKEKFNHYLQQNITPEIENSANKYTTEPSDENLRDLVLATVQFSFMPESFSEAVKMWQRIPINHTAGDWSDTHFDPNYKAKLIPQVLPTLIIGGELDQIISLTVFSTKKEYQRDNILIQSINQASHFPWFEKPKEVLDAILNFIDRFKLA